MDLTNAITEFCMDLRINGRARGTIHKHEQELNRLERWCKENELVWHQLDRRTLQRFVRARDVGVSARSNMLCTLRTFYAWSVEQEYVALSPAVTFKTPKKPQPLPRALSMEEVRNLLQYLNDHRETRKQRRDRVLMITLLYAGLRCMEAAALHWRHVDLKAGAIAIQLSKMGRGRAIPIHPELKYELERWRQEQQAHELHNGPIFSLDRQQVVPGRIGKIARMCAANCGIPFSAHMLRHTFATFALRGSHDVYAVSKALGHSQLKQTEIYVSADVEQLRDSVISIPGMNAW